MNINLDRRGLLGVACVVGAVTIALVAGGGPLNPPAGVVTGTAKPLSEVEPRTAVNATNTPGTATVLYRITQPGSYYLTGNIAGVAGKHGVEIIASGVTLDLNGFDLVGVGGTGTADGVSVTVSGLSNIAVLNGSIRSWSDKGIDTGMASGCRIDGVQAKGNSGAGIQIGIGSKVSYCAAFLNATYGIITGAGSSVSNCSAFQDSLYGIYVGVGSSVTGCQAYQNGSVGILAVEGCTIKDCAAYNNSAAGISATASTITGCTALRNTGTGIDVGDRYSISACSASFNGGSGINAGISGTITGCLADSNTGTGVFTSGACAITACNAYENSLGIPIFAGSTITGCNTRFNNTDGIKCASDCQVLNNNCDNNGANTDGANIHATGTDNLISGNNVTNADRGIGVDAGGNVIVRNTSSGNTNNYSIAANNVCYVVQGVTSGAFVGATGGNPPGTSDPNANFSY